MRGAVQGSLGLLMAALMACGAPKAPEIPPRDEIGPPQEAAQQDLCRPPYPMDFGDDWFLLADLDRGVGCYAYLERDECVLGIYDDCTDDSQDPRQWQGRVQLDVGTAQASLTTVHAPRGAGTVLPRSPECCLGELMTETPRAWALLSCRRVQCANANDVTHTGLYLEQWDPDLDPASAIQGALTLPEPARALAFEPQSSLLWAVAANSVFTADPATGNTAPRAALRDGSAIATEAGHVFVADQDRLWTRAAGSGAEATVDLIGPITHLAARDDGALAIVSGALGPTFVRIDVETATVVAQGPAPSMVTSFAGQDPAYVTAFEAFTIRTVAEDLQTATFYNLEQHLRQTTDAVRPQAVLPLPGGVAFLAPCHKDARKIHCVFETNGTGEPKRYGLAGVETLFQVHRDPRTDRLIAVDTRGRITLIERGSGRPLLQEQVRLEVEVVDSALDPARGILYVLQRGGTQVSVVNLSAFD